MPLPQEAITLPFRRPAPPALLDAFFAQFNRNLAATTQLTALFTANAMSLVSRSFTLAAGLTDPSHNIHLMTAIMASAALETTRPAMPNRSRTKSLGGVVTVDFRNKQIISRNL